MGAKRPQRHGAAYLLQKKRSTIPLGMRLVPFRDSDFETRPPFFFVRFLFGAADGHSAASFFFCWQNGRSAASIFFDAGRKSKKYCLVRLRKSQLTP
jgi:hypothetical protein